MINEKIKDFVSIHPNSIAFSSLGQLRYLSCIKHCDGLIGNSSSGLSEVPLLKKGTINIGDRQRGRIKAGSVIDCKPDAKSILNAIKLLYSAEFRRRIESIESPYYNGGVSEKIIKILENISLENILKKKFYDITVYPPRNV